MRFLYKVNSMKKMCKRCSCDKELDEFHIDKTAKDGHKNVCKSCLSVKRYKVSGVDKNIKQSLRYCLKYGGPFKWGKILGYSKSDIREQLEKNFKEGMNWENYGELWSCTTFIPRRCYEFSSLTSPELRKFWDLKNLKPEFKEECFKQKAEINMVEVEEQGLFDILPCGNIKSMLKGGKNDVIPNGM